MADKKSETLRQREKAQKDLLELKKIKQGQLDPEILRTEDKKLPMTFSEKVSNFFFHHKFKVIFGICAAIVLGIIIHSEVTKVRTDATLTLFCFDYFTEENETDIREWMEDIYPDTNNNGKTDISVQNCSFTLDAGNKPFIDQMLLKIQSIFLQNDAMLFIMDEDSLNYLRNDTQISLDLFPEENIVELGDEFDGLIMNNQTYNPDKKKYLCLRAIDGTTVKNSAKKNYDQAEKILDMFR